MKIKTAAAYANEDRKRVVRLAEQKLARKFQSLKNGESVEVAVPVKVTVRFTVSKGSLRQRVKVCCTCVTRKYSDGSEISWCNGSCC